MVTLIGAVAGAGLGAGLVVLLLGVRGAPRQGRGATGHPAPGRGGLALRAMAAALASIGVLALTGWPAGAVLAGIVAWLLPRALVRMRAEQDEIARTEAVAAWTEMLRDTLAAAAGLEEAIAASARAAPEAIREEVTALSRRLEREPLVPCLERFADEVSNPAADLVVTALVTAARREARDLVHLLGALAESARAEAEMRLRVRVSRTRVRTSARVVTGTLALFAGGLVVFNRAYLAPYATVEGQVVLLVVGAIFASGWALLHRMARIDAPERFFGGPAEGGAS